MKVKITQDAKQYLTVAEMPKVREIIKDMKEDDGLNEYAQIAARIASGENADFEILKAEAEIARNGRNWDNFSDGSGKLDIWIEVYAYNNYYGFYNIGAYLTDIWNVTGDNHEEIRQHMYIRKYKEER